MAKSKGRLIVFEGVDAVGKTTLSNDLCRFLDNKHIPVRRFHFPGKTPGTLGELIYRIHQHHAERFRIPSINACSLQLLHIAAHIDIIESDIKRSVRDGDWVVLDRFWWSTYVYGVDSGVSEESLELMIGLEKVAWGSVLPDVLLLIDAAAPLRDDETDCDAWHRKRELYLNMVKREQDQYRCVVIETESGNQARSYASERILREVLK